MSETSVDVRSYNVGKSDYAKHKIQPWDIWLEYGLNPWDADIVKRILRTKDEPGMTADESRILDYDKIIHICNERKRQLNLTGLVVIEPQAKPAIQYSLTHKQAEAYTDFCQQHSHSIYSKEIPTAVDNISVVFTSTSVGLGVEVCCNLCGESKNITEY